MTKTTTEPVVTELSADDLALFSAIILVIGDLIGLLSIIKARSENKSATEDDTITIL